MIFGERRTRLIREPLTAMFCFFLRKWATLQRYCPPQHPMANPIHSYMQESLEYSMQMWSIRAWEWLTTPQSEWISYGFDGTSTKAWIILTALTSLLFRLSILRGLLVLLTRQMFCVAAILFPDFPWENDIPAVLDSLSLLVTLKTG